jgi:succinate dehydrogenase flavin-adding protein (antitoxin of CptAB toxin-antitoxin module)
LADIEKKQQFRTNLQDGLEKASGKINSELSPMVEASQLFMRDYVIRLDELATEIGLGKYNREWFESYMADELDMLLDFFGHSDEVLAKLYTKYTNLTPENIAEDEDLTKMIKSMSETFGFEMDIKEFLEKGERAYFEAHKDEILEHMRNKGDFSETPNDESKKGKEKSKPVKPNQEAAQLAKDARSIYMRLIKKFHPDLETDPLIIEQKNEIIKEVTKAYQENDFFTLLKLQITHIDDNEKEAEQLADGMIKRYNKILQQQLNDLDRWIHEMHFASKGVIADFIDKNGKFSPQKFVARRREIEKEQAFFKSNLAESKKRPKGWFKEQIAMMKDISQQRMMEDIMGSMFEDF